VAFLIRGCSGVARFVWYLRLTEIPVAIERIARKDHDDFSLRGRAKDIFSRRESIAVLHVLAALSFHLL